MNESATVSVVKERLQQVQQSRRDCNRFSSLREIATGSAIKEKLQQVHERFSTGSVVTVTDNGEIFLNFLQSACRLEPDVTYTVNMALKQIVISPSTKRGSL